jgi:predicted MFS family arabinose efflux permease
MFAAFNLFISYGTWLLNDYGLSASTIGLVALIMGLADLCGSVSVSVVSDRFGKRRSVLTGAVMACLGFWVLPLLQATVVTAVIGLILIRSTFEFAIVANMALLSEQVPTQRAKLLTMGAAFSVISTGLAGFTGPWLLQQYGITWLTAVSGIAALLAVIMLLWRVLEPAETAVA